MRLFHFLGGAEVVVVAIFAFIYRKRARIMIILRGLGGQLSFFAGIVNNFMAFTYPASFGLVNLVRV